MDFFPAFLKLQDRNCLVVGGGNIAHRKIRLLDAAGARLTIVAPAVDPALKVFLSEKGHTVVTRLFSATDVQDMWLVVSATGDPATERCVYQAATAAGIFCNSVDDISSCSYITPAIVDRSPIVVAISSGGSAPVLARKLREKIEAVLPSGLSVLAQLAQSFRKTVSQHFDDLLGRRRYWEAVFDGPAASLAMSGRTDAAKALMTELLDVNNKRQKGEAWLVGAGPGNPDLLTLRALQIMQTADVILHDRLVSADILKLARRDADLISVGKTPGSAANSQAEINEQLLTLVRSGRRVCRLKGGDPFIFGRGGEEAAALADANLPYQVVPGITAAVGCAAYAGIPLTHRGLSQSVAFVTAHGQQSIDSLDWASLARDKQTLAFYMGVKRFPDLMNNLIRYGRSADTPVAIVENGTLPTQRVIRGALGQLALLSEANRVTAPAILLVGEVAALGDGGQFGQSPYVGDDVSPKMMIANRG